MVSWRNSEKNNKTLVEDLSYTLKTIISPNEVLVQLEQYSNHYDSYLVSPYYYLMTGRKGLNVLESSKNSILFSEHPNKENEIIVFPPICKEQVELINILLSDELLNSSNSVRLIRCCNKTEKLIESWGDKKYDFRLVTENLLDWKYPSVIISVDNVISRKGKDYQDLRYNINKVDVDKIDYSVYDREKHYSDAFELVKKWSARNISHLFNEENLKAPYEYLLQVSSKDECLKRYVLYYEGRLVAFNVLDNSRYAKFELVSLGFLADIDFKGIPSYMRYRVCESAKEMGIKTIHIGGSETKGLYRFKKKLVPTKELDMKSMIKL